MSAMVVPGGKVRVSARRPRSSRTRAKYRSSIRTSLMRGWYPLDWGTNPIRVSASGLHRECNAGGGPWTFGSYQSIALPSSAYALGFCQS